MKKISLFFVVFFVVLIVKRTAFTPQWSRYTFSALGTELSFLVCGRAQAVGRFFEETPLWIERYDSIFSSYREDSEVFAFNHRETEAFPVSQELFDTLSKALFFYEQTDGIFDVSLLPLSLFYKNQALAQKGMASEDIERILEKVGLSLFSIYQDQGIFYVKAPLSCQIDLGGIAKGAILEFLAQKAESFGIKGGVLSIGGDILCFGDSPSKEGFRIGIESFKEGEAQGISEIITLPVGAVAVSGDYKRYHSFQGDKKSHIIDPRTGYPAQEASQVTVVSDDIWEADVYATVFSILSVEEGREMAEDLRLPVQWIYNDDGEALQRHVSREWEKKFT